MANDELFLNSQTFEDILKDPTTSVDPTLRLPDHLLHAIFSYLSCHDLVHACLVSKNWHRNTPSHFALDFNESLLRQKNPISDYTHNEFWVWILSSLDASKSKLINAEKRILRVQFIDHGTIRDIMKFLDGNDFHEVYLRIKLLIVPHVCYYLPYIFQSKCLTVLHISHCGLDKQVLCGEEIIPSLQELKLDRVLLCEEILSKFISKCPYIRELSLVKCWGISFIVLTKLDFLKKLYVKLSGFHSFTNIQIVAPSLQVLHFVYQSQNNIAVNMDIRACKMLREFHLDCWKFPEGLNPEKFSSDFPHLETLLLRLCQAEKSLKISGPSLRKWVLSFPRLCSIKSIVSTPNISSFQYMGTQTIVLVPKLHEIMNKAWFIKLRSHFEKISNYNTTLDLRIREETSSGGHPRRKPSGRAPAQPLHHIKHLIINLNKLKYQQEYLMRYIIDNLLWMSHPNSLTLSIPTSFVPSAHEVSKKLYGSWGRNCCSGTRDKCWRHFLKHFEVKEEKKEQPSAQSSCYARPGKIKEVSDEKDKLLELIFVFTWQFNS